MSLHQRPPNLREALQFLNQKHNSSSSLSLRSISPSDYGRLLQACTSAQDSISGRQLHKLIIRSKLEHHIHLTINLFHMYLKCGCLVEARDIFDKISLKFTSVPLWTSMIAAYSSHRLHRQALHLFHTMLHQGIRPNSITFVDVLTACSLSSNLACGRSLHQQISETGQDQTNVIVATALIKMYAKCGRLEEAREIFRGIHNLDMIAWTAMIAAYAQFARCEDALKLCRYMQLQGEPLDQITFITVLSACADESDLPYGICIHTAIEQAGFDSDIRISNALIHMYGTCSSVAKARQVFDAMKARNVISWTVITAAYAQAGLTNDSLELFQSMQQQGVEPDSVSFVSILSACGHAGLTIQGLEFFSSMTQDHGISPSYEHYGCVLDLLGRAGWLDSAEEFIKIMPSSFQSDVKLWRAFLSACKTYDDRSRGQHAAGKLMNLHPRDSSGYVVLSNLYKKKS